jgi:hypothetical protein
VGRHQNAPDDPHRPRRRPTRGRGVAVVSLAGALVLAVVLGGGAYVLVKSHAGCVSTVRLSVVAAPDIAPAVRDMAGEFNAAHRQPDQRCVQVSVSARESADVMNALSDSGPIAGRIKPDVWIPDSSQWVDLVQSSTGGAGKTRMTGTTIAETPIIMAVPRDVADRTPGHMRQTRWRSLLPAARAGAGGLDVHLLDPTRNASGMGAMVTLQNMLGEGNAGLASLTAVVRRLQSGTAPDDSALFASFNRATGGRKPVLVTTEQSVWAYNSTTPARPATGVYPVEGSYNLDYPYVLTTGNGPRIAAAQAFRSAVTSRSAAASVHRLGFRTPDGAAGRSIGHDDGLQVRQPKALTSPSPGAVSDVLQAWKRLMLGSRMLTLLDVSGSMSTRVPGSDLTRMQAMVKVAQEGLREFPDSDEIGVRLFSTNLSGAQDWREVVPLGPLGAKIGGETRRARISAQLAAAAPKPDGDTGLYDSILAAYQKMVRDYQPDKINSVMVFTDGREDDANGISLDTLLHKLRAKFDPDRPVSVFSIGFGPDIDPSPLKKIAEATNGAVYVTEDPAQIRRVFLQAVSRRICAPNCPD